MPWTKFYIWMLCLSFIACFLIPTGCGGAEDDEDDEDDDEDDADDDDEPEEITAQGCVDAMTRLFGEDGCANPNEEPQYSDEEIQGACDQDFDVAAQSECHELAYTRVVACMEKIDCADVGDSYLAWTNCRIEFDGAINICECPPDGIC